LLRFFLIRGKIKEKRNFSDGIYGKNRTH
jgi:hypothetical protein